MPTQQIYFGNGVSLLDANSLYLDSGLTICAPDGWYSDGTIVRQQIGCVLLPPDNCSCGTPCSTISISSRDFSDAEFDIPFSSTSTGAVVIRIQPQLPYAIPLGFMGKYNGNFYNAGTGAVNGYMRGTPTNQPTFFGNSVYINDCDLDAPRSLTANNVLWNGTDWVNTGTLTAYTNPTQNVIISAAETEVVLVIPKTTATPSNYSLVIQVFCGAGFDVSMSCPAALPSFMSGNVVSSPVGNCSNVMNNTFYYAPFSGGLGQLALNNFVFQDPNGEYPLSDGYYRTTLLASPNDYIHVVNGVIVSIFKEPTCP